MEMIGLINQLLHPEIFDMDTRSETANRIYREYGCLELSLDSARRQVRGLRRATRLVGAAGLIGGMALGAGLLYLVASLRAAREASTTKAGDAAPASPRYAGTIGPLARAGLEEALLTAGAAVLVGNDDGRGHRCA